jgi:hypothetical protein
MVSMKTEEVSDTSNGGISNVALVSVLTKDLLSYVRFEHKSILLIYEGASAIVRIQTTQIWSRSSNKKHPLLASRHLSMYYVYPFLDALTVH